MLTMAKNISLPTLNPNLNSYSLTEILCALRHAFSDHPKIAAAAVRAFRFLRLLIERAAEPIFLLISCWSAYRSSHRCSDAHKPALQTFIPPPAHPGISGGGLARFNFIIHRRKLVLCYRFLVERLLHCVHIPWLLVSRQLGKLSLQKPRWLLAFSSEVANVPAAAAVNTILPRLCCSVRLRCSGSGVVNCVHQASLRCDAVE